MLKVNRNWSGQDNAAGRSFHPAVYYTVSSFRRFAVPIECSRLSRTALRVSDADGCLIANTTMSCERWRRDL